jgi:CIC family chloride channel protein
MPPLPGPSSLCLTTDENLHDAMGKFGIKDIGQLPVVDRKNPKKVVGMLKRTDVIVAYNNAVLRRSLERR